MRRAVRRYSFFSLLREARRHHSGWSPVWHKADPKPVYDAVIVGGGGHGLATAYYLAKRHGLRNVAVLEKGWLGGGNTARNTAIIRSNYLRPESMALYGLSHSLYENLSRELGFNVMFSPRGLVDLAFTRRDLDILSRTADANAHRGIASWMITEAEARSHVPLLGSGPGSLPVLGALWQPRGGIANHNAVAWAYARRASALGVDIVENCTVEQVLTEGGRVTGLNTSRGRIATPRILLATAADTPSLAAPLGVDLPIEPAVLQALVSEPMKPVLDVVVLAGQSHAYVSQSDKGEFVIGGATDPAPGIGRRGSPDVIEDTLTSLLEMFPSLSRVRMVRHWAGIVDITPDRSPIIGPAGPEGLFVNCGWGTGGFKAVPGSGYLTAALLADGTPPPVLEPFGLDRFARGRFIEEGAASAVAH
ncbi:sarcosine oxidase subunit beta family protein [Terrihabitans sp. B22-R8]|uniref:sarcosine oxidase subunit beta family protein n=1 Tax=Terrihabitans sp. B22-R8 TaxID=3425128 RepID=UPI00403CEE17